MIQNILNRICPVLSCAEVSQHTYLLRVSSPEIAALCNPGQFVNILVADYGTVPLLRRPFSISRVDGDVIELLFHAIGKGTILLSQKKSGDLLNIIGPLGSSFNTGGGYESAVILAGGIGIAPFPFLTSKLIDAGKKIQTYAGFRNSGQVYLENLQNVRISTEDGSRGFKGNVIQSFESFLKKEETDKMKIFACGPNPMLKALAEITNRKGIRCEVSLEGQMACGVGICQGCPVSRSGSDDGYFLICKDGPVFSADKIKL